jgi:hypothetical protein
VSNKIITFESVTKNEKTLVEELRQTVKGSDVTAMIFFCSSDYRLSSLATLLSRSFFFNVSGCTTAGEIATHYQKGGFVAVCFLSNSFHIQTHFIHNVATFTPQDAQLILSESSANLKYTQQLDHQNTFGFLMIDGLSMREESVVGFLYEVFNRLKIIGGSAGDDLQFIQTQVYHNGKFYSNAAVFLLVESKLCFETVKLQHFIPSKRELVVTKADPEKRTVYEINGGVAAIEYASILGVNVSQLSETIFSMYPVMLQIGNDWYVRSILKMNDDGSLTFGSAIDSGLPLTFAIGKNVLKTLSCTVDKIRKQFKTIDVSFGCDCILRKSEIEQKGLEQEIEAEFRKINFIGFNSYGEQYNSLHVNQTFIAIVLGEKKVESTGG